MPDGTIVWTAPTGLTDTFRSGTKRRRRPASSADITITRCARFLAGRSLQLAKLLDPAELTTGGIKGGSSGGG